MARVTWRGLAMARRTRQQLSQYKSLELNRLMLGLFGLWPSASLFPLTPLSLYRLVFPNFMAVTCIYLSFLSLPLGIYTTWGNHLLLCEESLIEFVAIMVFLKIAHLFYDHESFARLSDTVERLNALGRSYSQHERNILDKTQGYVRLTIVYVSICTGLAVFYMLALMPQLVASRRLYFNGWHPFDSFASPHFELLTAAWAFVIVVAVGMITVVDALLMALLIQTVGQYKILRYHLANIRRLAVDTVTARHLYADEPMGTPEDTGQPLKTWGGVRRPIVRRDRVRGQIETRGGSKRWSERQDGVRRPKKVDKMRRQCAEKCSYRHTVEYERSVEQQFGNRFRFREPAKEDVRWRTTEEFQARGLIEETYSFKHQQLAEKYDFVGQRVTEKYVQSKTEYNRPMYHFGQQVTEKYDFGQRTTEKCHLRPAIKVDYSVHAPKKVRYSDHILIHDDMGDYVNGDSYCSKLVDREDYERLGAINKARKHSSRYHVTSNRATIGIQAIAEHSFIDRSIQFVRDTFSKAKSEVTTDKGRVKADKKGVKVDKSRVTLDKSTVTVHQKTRIFVKETNRIIVKEVCQRERSPIGRRRDNKRARCGSDVRRGFAALRSEAARLGKLRREARSKATKEEIDQEMARRITSCVQHQMSLHRFLYQLESVFNVLLIWQYVCNLLATGVAVLYVTMLPVIDMKAVMILTLAAAALVELFLFTYLSNQVTDESSKVKDAVYDCDWYEATTDFKRSMGMIIMRANQPVGLRVGGNIPLDLPSFHNVTKMTYSYIMAVRTAISKSHASES